MVTTDPLVPAEARDSRKCTARSKRSGKPCERWSMVGQTTCAMHGGKAPQALRKAQAAVELAELRIRCAFRLRILWSIGRSGEPVRCV